MYDFEYDKRKEWEEEEKESKAQQKEECESWLYGRKLDYYGMRPDEIL